jgi:hypothetical protein
MADWLDNNRACKTLWTTLYTMHQLSTNFTDSGELKMSDLTFYNPLDSADMRKQAASLLADQLDNTFRIGRGATYEDSFDRTKAITDMTAMLTEAEKQVADLAFTVDTIYNFWGETKV